MLMILLEMLLAIIVAIIALPFCFVLSGPNVEHFIIMWLSKILDRKEILDHYFKSLWKKQH